MAKTWAKEQINSVKKKTSIGHSRLSSGAGTNKRKTRKKYRGQGKMTQYKNDVAKQKAKLKAEEDDNKVISWEFQKGANLHFRKITYASGKVVTTDLSDKD
jgi:hypothetical protein